MSCLEKRKGYFISNAIAFTGSERLVGLIENEPISTRRLNLCPALPVLIFFAIETCAGVVDQFPITSLIAYLAREKLLFAIYLQGAGG